MEKREGGGVKVQRADGTKGATRPDRKLSWHGERRRAHREQMRCKKENVFTSQ